MAELFPLPDPVHADWVTAALRASARLVTGKVHAVEARAVTGTFNSRATRLALRFSDDATGGIPAKLLLKQNIAAEWSVQAGQDEARFYRTAVTLDPTPPSVVPCLGAQFDAPSGNSYLLLEDVSATHAPPVTREQQIGLVDGVPAPWQIDRVVDALARHHGYWWDHPLLHGGQFAVGYWSRNSERFQRYIERRRLAWEDLRDGEADWYWMLVPVQDRHDGASRDYWWPKLQCLVAAFRDWRCAELLG